MPSKAITPKTEVEELDLGKPIRETAPSVLQADVPTVARGVGFVGLLLFVLGAVAVIFDLAGSQRYIGGGFGTVLGFIGLICLLYHAGRETDAAIRRMYGVLGGVGGLLLALALAIYPAEVGTPMAPQTVVGAKFLPWGLVGLCLSLVFVLPATRGEAEDGLRKGIIGLVGLIGAALALGGVIGGIVSSSFFLPLGLLLSLVGLAYTWAFITLVGSESDVGHRTGQAVALFGGVVMLVAFFLSKFHLVLFYALARTLRIFGTPDFPDLSYFTSTGIVIFGVGLLYALGGLGFVSERPTFVLLRRELASFVYSPLIYFILFGFGVMAWFNHWIFVEDASRQPVLEPIVWPYIWGIMPVIFFILMVPMLTMRLLSEEDRSGTLEMLMTVPLNETAVVLSKFFAVLIVFMLSWVPFGIYLTSLAMGSGQTFDYRPIISFVIALIASGSSLVAMGLFFSSLTRSQLAAFVLTALGMILLTATYWIKNFPQLGETGQAVLTNLSYIDLWRTTLQGKVQLGTMVMNLGLAAFWLFGTVKVLESRKWR
jgi:ABC-2 type transport system permease protein